MSGHRVAAVLPHLGLYGGNLRYVELGNALTDSGVEFTLATPDGNRPDFLEYRGRVATFEELRADPPDVLLASEQNLFDTFRELPAGRKFFYFIIEGTKREAEIARTPRLEILANSSGMAARLRKRYGVRAVPIVGGINLKLFHPPADDERERRPPERFAVIANGRFSRRRKGTRIVAAAMDRLARRHAGLELRLFDASTVDHVAAIPEDFRCGVRVRLDLDVPREQLRLQYGAADLFVSAEKKAGWSNLTIEAMACGIPVVCTSSGTTDFAIDGETALVVPRRAAAIAGAIGRLRGDEALRTRLAAAGLAKAREFAWERTALQLAEAIGVGDAVRA